MRKLATLALLTSAGALLISAPADAGKKKKNAMKGVPTQVGPIKPKPNMHLRQGFDTDPSMFIGRFIPKDSGDFDETTASKTACSQFVTYRKVGGGGVTYDEVYQASTSAAASFGIPVVAKVSGGAETGASVRVKYTLTNKMVADIEDPAGFEACCKGGSDQCTDLYIGEFIEGTGQLFYAANTGGDMSAKGATTKLMGDVEVKNGVTWSKSIEFPNPVYFAFKTTANQWAPGPSGCGDWVNAPPKSTHGEYFVGISESVPSEKIARDLAMRNARLQTIRWAAEQIEAGAVDKTTIGGDVSALRAAVDSEETVEATTAGVASLVKDENWCVTTQGTPDGNVFTAKVLAFVPKDRAADLANAALSVPH